MKTRPYYVDFNGKVRMVEASHQNAAIAHLARQLVKSIRPATAKEVAEHYRAGNTVEVAGEEPEQKPAWPVEGSAPQTQYSTDKENWFETLPDWEQAVWVRASEDGGQTWGAPMPFNAQAASVEEAQTSENAAG